MANVKPKPELSNEEYIEAHLVYDRNAFGHWQVAFECADGYRISVSEEGNGRLVKPHIKEVLLDKVLNQYEHSIQPRN